MKEIDKGSFGYLEYRKNIQIIKAGIGIILAFSILLGGFLVCGTKNNICTVIATILALPTAKFMVTLLIVIKYKSPDAAQYNSITTLGSNLLTLCDCVMSCKDKITFCPYVIVTDTCIYCYSTDDKIDKDFFETSISDFIRSCGDECPVKLFKDYNTFEKRIKSLNNLEYNRKKAERIKEAFLILVI